jgi:RNA polymerase sigma-70 factor (ECF subfamily)
MPAAAEDTPNGHTIRGNQPPAEPHSTLRSMYAEHRPHLDIHRSPRAWLATTTRHLAIDAHRARRARPHEVELDHRPPPITSQPADASIDETGVRAAVGALPCHQRRVLAEVYYHDRSVAETARILQIPVGTVKSRIFYGLRALRRALAAQDAVASARAS